MDHCHPAIATGTLCHPNRLPIIPAKHTCHPNRPPPVIPTEAEGSLKHRLVVRRAFKDPSASLRMTYDWTVGTLPSRPEHSVIPIAPIIPTEHTCHPNRPPPVIPTGAEGSLKHRLVARRTFKDPSASLRMTYDWTIGTLPSRPEHSVIPTEQTCHPDRSGGIFQGMARLNSNAQYQIHKSNCQGWTKFETR